MKNYKTIILMPYFPIGGYLKFNSLIIWSYKKYKDEFITHTALREHLDKILASYQLHNGRALENPAIISVGKINFSNPTNKTVAKIEVLKNILQFTNVFENNSWSFTTSDNFEVFYQNFTVGNDSISTSAGAIHRISTGGYKIGQVSFVKPEHVHIPMQTRVRSSIFRALENCLVNSHVDTSKSQVIQSLNPFFNAYRNSHEQSWASRVLLLIMAFELLFGETDRINFRNNIRKYSFYDPPSIYTLATHSYPIINTKTGGVISQENLTLNQIWAEEFYKLRHRIIHGDTIYSDDFVFKDLLSLTKPREPHFYIAVNFFVVCLLNKLREMGFSDVPHYIINPTGRTTAFSKNISGIQNETFKLEDIEMYDMLRSLPPTS